MNTPNDTVHSAFKAAFLARLDTIENQKSQLLERVAALPAAQLHHRPTDDSWSILEIVEHMILAEDHVFRGMPTPASLPHRKRTPGNYLFYLMVLGILRFKIPVSVPARDMRPAGKLDLDTLVKRWHANHTWLRAYIAQQDDEGLKKAVFTHPASGPMSTRQMFAMMEAHMDRHVEQINKRLAQNE